MSCALMEELFSEFLKIVRNKIHISYKILVENVKHNCYLFNIVKDNLYCQSCFYRVAIYNILTILPSPISFIPLQYSLRLQSHWYFGLQI